MHTRIKAELPDTDKLKESVKFDKFEAPNPLKSAKAAARVASKSSLFGGLGAMFENLEKEGLALEAAEKEKKIALKLANIGGSSAAANGQASEAGSGEGAAEAESAAVAGGPFEISDDDLEEAFDLLATDDVIGEAELRMLMAALGEQPTEVEIAHLLWEHGSVFEDSEDAEASLDFDEFLESRLERKGMTRGVYVRARTGGGEKFYYTYIHTCVYLHIKGALKKVAGTHRRVVTPTLLPLPS